MARKRAPGRSDVEIGYNKCSRKQHGSSSQSNADMRLLFRSRQSTASVRSSFSFPRFFSISPWRKSQTNSNDGAVIVFMIDERASPWSVICVPQASLKKEDDNPVFWRVKEPLAEAI